MIQYVAPKVLAMTNKILCMEKRTIFTTQTPTNFSETSKTLYLKKKKAPAHSQLVLQHKRATLFVFTA